VASIVETYGPFLRVEDAAQLLCISRTSAYALANQWLSTNGLEGLPAVRIGRSIRIPAVALDRLADPSEPAAVAPLLELRRAR
jgi:hypothetical protein